jgi:hypothetical protein
MLEEAGISASNKETSLDDYETAITCELKFFFPLICFAGNSWNSILRLACGERVKQS